MESTTSSHLLILAYISVNINWNRTILVSNPNQVGVLLNSDYKRADYYGYSYGLNLNKGDYT